ncbi:chloride channel protein [Actinomyces vulturis]|uniref:chloride channel protein n=1 Tax=Actinomyces vulturis TaxID=1857645 RepID=UPI0009F3EF94|nr:chloride channel protein [Actinomyces vulturis]
MQLRSRSWQPLHEKPRDGARALVELSLFMGAAVVIGAVTGCVSVSFLLLLRFLGERRVLVMQWAHEGTWVQGILVVLIVAVMAALAAAMVKHLSPEAEGSGIPRVEAIATHHMEPGPARILPIKYLGGLLSIGAGLALGREGPSVQMGATIAGIGSKVFRRPPEEMRTLIAAGAAAGLATAFNAPIAGAIFVLEELLKRFDTKTTMATLTASASAFAVAQLFVDSNELSVAPLRQPRLEDAAGYVVVGIVVGLLAVAYNSAIMGALRFVDRSRVPVELRAAFIGGVVALVGMQAPHLIGGGEPLTSRILHDDFLLSAIVIILVLRFALGALSYAALTPGGLFAPMLVVGASAGLMVGKVGNLLLPVIFAEPAALALAGMAAFFAASVRAPVTGIILATEMTGSVILLPPMLGASAVAVMVAILWRCEPIYDQLARRSAQASNEYHQKRSMR